jgi:hypothetical protein
MSGQMQTLIKSVNWQDPSKFKIMFTGPGAGTLSLPSDKITMACKGISLASVTGAPIEQFIAEEWRFAIGRLESYQITISFLDYNNFTLYKKFAKAIQKFLRMYPDDQKFNIHIYTADNFTPAAVIPIIDFKDCILMSIEAPTLDNSAVASVAEFSVSIKCSYAKVK